MCVCVQVRLWRDWTQVWCTTHSPRWRVAGSQRTSPLSPPNLSTSPRTPPLSSSTTAGWYTNGLGNLCKEKPFHRFKVIHKSLICTFAVGDPNSTICKTFLLSIFIMASCMYRHVGAGLCLSPSLSREQPPWPTWWECGPWQEELLYLLKLDSPPTSSQLLPSCRSVIPPSPPLTCVYIAAGRTCALFGTTIFLQSTTK